MPKKRQFGLSTHLYHSYRLTREHLLEMASFGFDTVELFATRTHFDYHNPATVADLQQWLAEAGLELHAVHAPIGESFTADRWGPPLTLASADRDTRGPWTDRARAPDRAADSAGVWSPTGGFRVDGQNSRDGARRSSTSCSGSRRRSASGWRLK